MQAKIPSTNPKRKPAAQHLVRCFTYFSIEEIVTYIFVSFYNSKCCNYFLSIVDAPELIIVLLSICVTTGTGFPILAQLRPCEVDPRLDPD